MWSAKIVYGRHCFSVHLTAQPTASVAISREIDTMLGSVSVKIYLEHADDAQRSRCPDMMKTTDRERGTQISFKDTPERQSQMAGYSHLQKLWKARGDLQSSSCIYTRPLSVGTRLCLFIGWDTEARKLFCCWSILCDESRSNPLIAVLLWWVLGKQERSDSTRVTPKFSECHGSCIKSDLDCDGSDIYATPKKKQS